ncbi:MAG: hypothetical protein QW279_05115 [Candidatus Jordarchaeaceae archaeon]
MGCVQLRSVKNILGKSIRGTWNKFTVDTLKLNQVSMMSVNVMKIVIDVPDGVTEEEIKVLIQNYLKKKKKFEEFYELVEDVDWDELKKEAENFRKSFKFRESTC